MSTPSTTTATMKALIAEGYGPPETLRYTDVPIPSIEPDQILIEVRAASANPYDLHVSSGKPFFVRMMMGLRRPKQPIQGADVAGVVAEVGADAAGFAVGDEVYGEVPGSFAQYLATTGSGVAAKPSNMTFEEAAGVPMCALTALQGLRDRGGMKEGTRVLVVGASGGVGSFAVQIAKVYGAHVTAVCSTENIDMVQSLGADSLVDYKKVDVTTTGPYDLILDTVGTAPLGHLRRAMTDEATYVAVGGSTKIGELIRRQASMFLGTLFRRTKPMRGMVASVDAADLDIIRGLIEEGHVRTIVQRRFPLARASEALQALAAGHAKGKTIVVVKED